MDVTREMLMAYADGELDELTARRVEKAIAEDPELAAQLEADEALRAKLRSHLEPAAEEDIPEAWMAMIAEAAEEDRKVVSLADVREKRQARGVPRWGAGVAIAASLALGVMLGTQVSSGGSSLVEKDGMLLASAGLEQALDRQLASAQEGEEVRILASFQRDGGDYCRAFAGTAHSGIACREAAGWRLQRLLPGAEAHSAQYRQAGSAEAELMAAAQDMAKGEPLDAAQEKAARDKGWQ
jgi:negative regulator of sigma E activity